MVSDECTLLFALCCLTCHVNAIGLSFFMYNKIYWKVYDSYIQYFLVLLQHAHCILFSGLSQVYEVLFLLKNFSDWGNFFLHSIAYSKVLFTALPAVSLWNMYCVMFWFAGKNTNLKVVVSRVLFTVCYLVMRTFHLFSCWVECFPIDYYKRKMDQLISNVNFKE